MAIGVQKKTSTPLDVGTEQEPTNLEKTIGTLRRCLQIAGTSNKPGSRSAKNSISEESNDLTMEESVPEASKWPHCQHMISQDEAPRNDELASPNIRIVAYKDESQINDIMRLITKDLSEPYSIYTYRYFLHNWPEYCFLAYDQTNNTYIGAVLCKLELDMYGRCKGYLAMLAVDESCRRLGIGTRLVRRALDAMQSKGCDEIVLETEVSNKNAQRLYSNLGFIRQKRLLKYYLNGGDAFRLKLIFTSRRVRSLNNQENYQPRCRVNEDDTPDEEEGTY
ncbi:N-terminal methionine N(alpha)-acetyltransferase NatC [Caenorhabditis elegans]|uniref:N-terminal methionine N(alpha)-acetyltransferase NatC n=1 Tax=Caenorhabditis elegans TaxID=6239 RepID=O16486_CAEEL|nr:N-acetyltransferase domain-containing protein [Caenorhabditis elegans]CCD61490.1 N-acetyltransferase domain-containing protein [Caenorhabditis elegans]|eukprot:NP_504411.1 N-alpha-AcetylTransferase C complex subunit [Caenorhabditis elegans]